MFPTVTAVMCTLLFIIPGFIIESMMCRLSAIPQGKYSDHLLRQVLYSAISAAVSLYFIVQLLDTTTYTSKPLLFLLYAGLTIFLIPFCIGLLFALFIKYDLDMKFFKALGFNPKTRVHTGWDDFGHLYCDEGVRAKVTLKSGKIVYIGFKGRDIISSSDSDNADIYASELYSFDENDPDPNATWSRCETVTGVIIPRETIDVLYVFGADKDVIYKSKKEKKKGEQYVDRDERQPVTPDSQQTEKRNEGYRPDKANYPSPPPPGKSS